MGLLTSTNEDFQGRGAPLPPRVYRVTVVEAQVEQLGGGTTLRRMYGNIRTPEGAVEFPNGDGRPYIIGNRKLFARSWIDHTNPQAAEIGQREIKREAVSAGLMPKPEKGQSVELDFPSWEAYAEALVGRDVLVRTKLGKNRQDEEVAEVATWVDAA